MTGAEEVAGIFRQFGQAYRQQHADTMAVCQLKAMRAIEICRTEALGGHVDACEQCGALRISYNSCRNRHCPKCQGLNKERWLDARRRELLPVKYFHVVFTLPEALRPLALGNPREIYTLLFACASATLKQLAADPKHLGADIGFMAMLHTWNQTLGAHPHLHCIVTGGGLADGNRCWKGCRRRFFLPVRVMASLFRGKFLDGLKQAFEAGRLGLGPRATPGAAAFRTLLDELYAQNWVLYCKPPLYGAESVVEYFARYSYRVAISNNRIVGVDDGRVTFRYRDRSDKGRLRSLSLRAEEFIRRFLLHILPDRFVKIRYYGIMSNRHRKKKLQICRRLLEAADADVPADDPEAWQDLLFRVTGVDVRICPNCGGRLVFQSWLMPYPAGVPP